MEGGQDQAPKEELNPQESSKKLAAVNLEIAQKLAPLEVKTGSYQEGLVVTKSGAATIMVDWKDSVQNPLTGQEEQTVLEFVEENGQTHHQAEGVNTKFRLRVRMHTDAETMEAYQAYKEQQGADATTPDTAYFFDTEGNFRKVSYIPVEVGV